LIKKVLGVFFTFFCLYSFGQNQPQIGKCSYYADKFHGRKTASGEVYNNNLFTAAHRSLPFNTVVLVTNLRNQKKVLVKINDRGPLSHGRIIDLSKAAAVELEIIPYGVEKVSVEVVDFPPGFLIQDTTGGNAPYSNKDQNKKVEKIQETGNKNMTMDAGEKPVPANGYGIQIGYYKILDNCKNQLADVQKRYQIKGYVHSELRSGKTYYCLIIGAFADKKKALELQSELKKEVPGCFLINWSSLK